VRIVTFGEPFIFETAGDVILDECELLLLVNRSFSKQQVMVILDECRIVIFGDV
jgi:hypothetical protein